MLAVLEHALSSLPEEQDPVRVERVAAAALFVDRIDSARQPLLRLLDAARAGTSTGSGILALMLLAVEDFRRGRWSDARAFAEEGLQMADEHGLDLLAWPLKLTQAWLAAGTGDHRALQSLLDQMHAWATPRQVGTVLDYAHHAAGLGALGRGDYLTAFSELSQVSSPGELRSHVGHALWAAMDLVEAAVHAGHQDAAAAHVAAMRRARVGELSGRLRLVEAGAAAMAATPFDRRLFDRALATARADDWPFELARIRLCYGQLLRRDRSAAEARRHLRAALSTFRELGANEWVYRAEQELEATSQVKHRTDRHEVASPLTPQEFTVATLASRGLTNQQIADQLLMSPRTAGAHLRGVYRKLGVAGRGGLHQALAERQGAPTGAPARD
jgi:DNA-binding CsgD family transcriptional regulator